MIPSGIVISQNGDRVFPPPRSETDSRPQFVNEKDVRAFLESELNKPDSPILNAMCAAGGAANTLLDARQELDAQINQAKE